MNCSGDCSKAECTCGNKTNWKPVKEDPPMDGEAVLILQQWGSNNRNDWTTDIAYYCDKDFYCLEYDQHLGILRKTFVNGPVKYWARYLVPEVAV